MAIVMKNGFVLVLLASSTSGLAGAVSLLVIANSQPAEFLFFAQIWGAYSAIALPLSVGTSWGFGERRVLSKRAQSLMLFALLMLVILVLPASLILALEELTIFALSSVGLFAVAYTKYKLGQNYLLGKFGPSSASIFLDGASRLGLLLVFDQASLPTWYAIPLSSILAAAFIKMTSSRKGTPQIRKNLSDVSSASLRRLTGDFVIFAIVGISGIGALSIWNAYYLLTSNSELNDSIVSGVVFGRTAALYLLISIQGPILRLLKSYKRNPVAPEVIVSILVGLASGVSELALSTETIIMRPLGDTGLSMFATAIFSFCVMHAFRTLSSTQDSRTLTGWLLAFTAWAGSLFLFTLLNFSSALDLSTLVMAITLGLATAILSRHQVRTLKNL